MGPTKKKKGKKSKKTKHPTRAPTRPPTPELTHSYGCNVIEKEFQLKMFWEEGMEWQEDPEEKAWCAECEESCSEEGENVIIKECDENDSKQWWIFSDCHVQSYRDPNMCFTSGVARKDSLKGKIELHECKDSKIQKFRTFDPKNENDKFQVKILKPENDELCLTQEHHPKAYEYLRFEECRIAEENDPGVEDDTSHWVVGVFEGHPSIL